MQAIFQYDVDRLTSYSVNTGNNIKIADEKDYMMLSFPGVDYFNYAFPLNEQSFTAHHLKNIKDFYSNQQVKKHKVIVAATDIQSNQILTEEPGYQQAEAIAKTIFPLNVDLPSIENRLRFIKVDSSNIQAYTEVYLNSFEAQNKNVNDVLANFETLLALQNLDLFLLQYRENYVGVNVLYKTAGESFLAGGAVLPEYRNHGFHLSSLAFRIQLSLIYSDTNDIVSWAYNPGTSLKNMLKLKMQIRQEFMVYEYSK